MVKKAPIRASSGAGGQSRAAGKTTTLSGVSNVRGHKPTARLQARAARTAAINGVISPEAAAKAKIRAIQATSGASMSQADRIGARQQIARIKSELAGTRSSSGGKGSGSIAGKGVPGSRHFKRDRQGRFDD